MTGHKRTDLRPYYRQAKRIADARPLGVYWRIVFAQLSVHTDYSAGAAAYTVLRDEARHDRERRTTEDVSLWGLADKIAKVRAPNGHSVAFPTQKARFINEFTHAWRQDFRPFMPRDDSREHRDRLARTVPGLHLAKASFAVGLIDPIGADVICIDRHMARLLGVQNPDRRREYEQAEELFRKRAREQQVPMFLLQWALWDEVRGHHEPHEELAREEHTA